MASVAPLSGSDTASLYSVTSSTNAPTLSSLASSATSPPLAFAPGLDKSTATLGGSGAGAGTAKVGGGGQRETGHYNSSDVDLPLRVRVVAFEGSVPEPDIRDILEDPYQRLARYGPLHVAPVGRLG